MGYLNGYPEPPNTAFLVGSYVHAWAEGNLEQFISDHQEQIQTKQGKLRAEFEQANQMIATLQSDPFVMHTLTGQHEVIMTADLFGATWKAMFDVYVPGKRIVDLKTTRAIRGYKSFIEQYDYFSQVALYLEIERINAGRPEGEWLEFYMVAVSKETIPDKEVINLTDYERIAVELAKIEGNMTRIHRVKSGEIEPLRCEQCDYCKATKKLTRAIDYRELEVS